MEVEGINLRHQDLESFLSNRKDPNVITYILDMIGNAKDVYVGYMCGNYTHNGIKFSIINGECQVDSDYINKFIYEPSEDNITYERYIIYAFSDGSFLIFDDKNGSFYRLCLSEGLEFTLFNQSNIDNYYNDYMVENVNDLIEEEDDIPEVGDLEVESDEEVIIEDFEKEREEEDLENEGGKGL